MTGCHRSCEMSSDLSSTIEGDLSIGWKVASLSPGIASVRYRALVPLLSLEDSGYRCHLYSKTWHVNLDELDALVIVKSFSADDLLLMHQAVSKGVPVVLDLCDNIFISSYGASFLRTKSSPAALFLEMARMAQAVVVPTETLAGFLKRELGSEVSISVIPDGVENKRLLEMIKSRLKLVAAREKSGVPEKIARYFSILKSRLCDLRSASCTMILRLASKKIIKQLHWRTWAKRAYRILNRIRSLLRDRQRRKNIEAIEGDVDPGSNDCKRILWFGNHGAEHASFGMLDLQLIREPLEKISADVSVELIVISNNKSKYIKHIKQFAIPTRYIEWSADTIEYYLNIADVVVIPNSLDEFSICKSPNRAVLALTHEVPVVATRTPALGALEGCIVLDNFEDGLRQYLANPELSRKHVQKSKEIIQVLYGQTAISAAWGGLLDKVVKNNILTKDSILPEWIFALQLPQDIDLALPILEAASKQNIRCSIWSGIEAVNRWPQLLTAITQSGFPYRILPEQNIRLDTSIFPQTTRVLLSISESNLNPHRFTHQLTLLANRAGLFTATVQHGFENIGLTYSDGVHSIRRISFASQRIYTWGSLENCHPKVPGQTRRKCVPVGCPKPERVATASIMQTLVTNKPLIGIFENLHWHRYSEEYQVFFVESVSRLASTFPNVDFVIKPHNAGMWLTNRSQQECAVLSNLAIIDPMDPGWALVTAPQMLGCLVAVITTPSTVAIDALRQGLPVALVKHGLDLAKYAPLPMIDDFNDWCEFVNQVLDEKTRVELEQRGRELLRRVIMPGDAALRIVEDLVIEVDATGVAHA